MGEAHLQALGWRREEPEGGAEAAKPESNKPGDTYAVTWEDIREGYRVRCMDHGRKIALKTWEKNYLPTINEALNVLAAGKATDGPTLLRETARSGPTNTQCEPTAWRC